MKANGPSCEGNHKKKMFKKARKGGGENKREKPEMDVDIVNPVSLV